MFLSEPAICGLVRFKTEKIYSDSDVIWGFDFLDKNQMVFTLRSDEIKVLNLETKKTTSLPGSPAVKAKGQGGLLDIRVSPTNKNQIYFSYAKPDLKNSSLASTALARAIISEGKLKDVKDLFVGNNLNSEGIHFGSRIEFSKDGYLFLSIGERNERQKAQMLNQHNGKLMRLKMDGSNPEVWTLGHRNPQGLAKHPITGELWLSEFGPRGGDELNLIQKGKNYGWPDVTKGREYYGPSIGVLNKDGIEEPVVFWVPSISPSGSNFYQGDQFPEWKNNLFIGCLSGMHLRRIVIQGNKVIEQEELLKELKERIRNVRGGPEGNIYISTDSGNIYRLSPNP